MREALHKIKALFKMALLLKSNDSPGLRKGLFFFQGQTIEGTLFTPYGFMHNPPPNSIVMVWSQNSHESQPIGIADAPRSRTLRNLAVGEVALGNSLTGSYLYLKEDGSIQVETNAASFLVNGNTIVFTTGSTTYTFAEGGLTVEGGDVTADGITLKTHRHSDVEPGGGNSGPPIP